MAPSIIRKWLFSKSHFNSIVEPCCTHAPPSGDIPSAASWNAPPPYWPKATWPTWVLWRMASFPGRTAGRDYSEPTAAHLEATTLIEVQIEERSAKARAGGPTGPQDGEVHAPFTCGVVPL